MQNGEEEDFCEPENDKIEEVNPTEVVDDVVNGGDLQQELR